MSYNCQKNELRAEHMLDRLLTVQLDNVVGLSVFVISYVTNNSSLKILLKIFCFIFISVTKTISCLILLRFLINVNYFAGRILKRSKKNVLNVAF